MRFRTDGLIILIIALLPILFFWRLAAPKPEDQLRIATGDFTEQYFPLRAFSAREWVNGRVPLWNPYIFGGQPGLADIQSGALYPPHVLQALALGWLGIGFPLWALEWQVIFHFALAGVGAYLLGRYWARRAGSSWRVGRFVGVVMSLAFTYSGYLTGFPVQQMTILLVSAWLPWVMWTLARALDAVEDGLPLRISLARDGWTALAFSMAVLAGHPQTVMYIFYLMLAYGVFQGLRFKVQGSKFKVQGSKFGDAELQSGKATESPITNLTFHASRFTHHVSRFAFHWLLVVVLGGLIAAAQLLPTLEFIRHSLRAELPFGAVSAGLPLSELVSLVYPGYFGGSPEYVGIFTLLLVAAALMLSRPSLRGTIRFWLGVAVVALVLAFGANTFLYPFFYLSVPGFAAVRQQERVFLLYSFALSVLAGYGALALALPLPKQVRPMWQGFARKANRVGAVALALTGLFVYGAVSANVRGDDVNLFNGVLRHHVFGLIIYGGGLLMLALRPRRFWRRWWGMTLAAAWLAFNLFSVNWQFNLEHRALGKLFAPTGVSQFLIEKTATQTQPIRVAGGGLLNGGNNAGAVLGLEDITGNTPLQLANVAAFNAQMPAWRLWQLMNVRYVVDKRDIDGAGLARRFEADGVKVFEVGDPFPRARMVYNAIYGAGWRVLAEDATDLKTTALLPPGTNIPFTAPNGPAAATVTGSYPGWLAVAVETAAAGLLVVSNIDYPGWQATLDGAPVPVLQTNGVFQGVAVPAGRHTVILAFKPQTFLWGGVLSVLGLLLAGGLASYELRKTNEE